MDERKNDPVLGSCQLVAATVLWGTVGPAQALAGNLMSPAALGGWRLLVGGAALGALTLSRPGRLRAIATRSALSPLLVCALSTGLYQAVFLSSVARTGAALATVIALGSAPVATGVCARWANRERIGLGWAASTAAAGAGCVLLLVPGASRADPLGVALAGMAGICYALYTVFAKRLADADPAADLPALSALSLLAGALVLLPWMFEDSAALSDGAALALIGWLGVGATAIPYWLYSVGLTRVRAVTAGTLSLGEPMTAALISVLLLREHLSGLAWGGCALILAGMAAACLPSTLRGEGRPRETRRGLRPLEAHWLKGSARPAASAVERRSTRLKVSSRTPSRISQGRRP